MTDAQLSFFVHQTCCNAMDVAGANKLNTLIETALARRSTELAPLAEVCEVDVASETGVLSEGAGDAPLGSFTAKG